MKAGTALLLFVLAAAPAPAGPDPKLDMIAFFTGKTHADNVIKIALHSPHNLIVDSIGGRNKEGEFILIDYVQEEGKPARKRTWAMRPDGTNHFTGSLSDAIGPVDVVVAGSNATIRYTMRDGGMKVEQRLALQSNGTLSNQVIARKFGLKFATVQGTIRKLD
jgi:6-phosphogluconate dehydrogenase (decarboxylating)